MSVHKKWMNGSMLSIAFTDEQARDLVCHEEDDRCARGADRSTIRAELARDIGIFPGTIENLRRRRFSSLRTVVRDRIQAWTVRQIHQEITRLEHDLSLALQCGESPSGDEVIAAKAALAKARTLLKQAASAIGER